MTQSDFCDTGLSIADELKGLLLVPLAGISSWGCSPLGMSLVKLALHSMRIITSQSSNGLSSKNIPGTVSKSVIALVVSGTGVLAAQSGRSTTHAAGQVVLAAAPSSVGALTGQQRQHLVYPGGAAEC